MCGLSAEARKDLSPQTETPQFLCYFFPLPTTLTAVICVSVEGPVLSPLLPKAQGGVTFWEVQVLICLVTVGLFHARTHKLGLLFRASIKPGHFIDNLTFWKPPMFHGVWS